LAPPVPIPVDVLNWLRDQFKGCNEHVSALLSRVPTTHEPNLDMAFIEHFAGVSAPVQFPSGWVVELSTHFLGGGRHFSEMLGMPPRWEIADIGFLVLFRQGGQLLRSKVALLQSKRLYADELDWDEDNPLDYMVGFRRLYRGDEEWSNVVGPRRFGFTEQSQYKALVKGVQQYSGIASYETQRGIPVYYLLYNPWQVPHSVVFPLTAAPQAAGTCDLGCRVVPSSDVRSVLADRPDGSSPSLDDLRRFLPGPFTRDEHQSGWRLEHFVVDLLLDCQAGHIAESPNDSGLNYIFNRRSGPISAAVALTIDAP